MRICPRCGRENNNNNKYCDQCGTVLAGMETSKSSRTAFVLLSAVTVILTVLFVSVVVLLVKRTASPPETPSADAATEQKTEEAADEGKTETTQALVFPNGALSYNGHHYYIYMMVMPETGPRLSKNVKNEEDIWRSLMMKRRMKPYSTIW